MLPSPSRQLCQTAEPLQARVPTLVWKQHQHDRHHQVVNDHEKKKATATATATVVSFDLQHRLRQALRSRWLLAVVHMCHLSRAQLALLMEE